MNNYQKYAIICSYNKNFIEKELRVKISNKREIYNLQQELFKKLTYEEKEKFVIEGNNYRKR